MQEDERPTPKRPDTRRWWLPVAVVVSLLIHLTLGYVAQKSGIFGPQRTPEPPVDNQQVQVTMIDKKPAAAPPKPQATPEPQPTPGETPKPAPTPQPAATPGPKPTPGPNVPKPVATPLPVPTAQPTVQPTVKPVPTPQPTVKPTVQPTPPPDKPISNRPITPLPRNTPSRNTDIARAAPTEDRPLATPDTPALGTPDAPNPPSRLTPKSPERVNTGGSVPVLTTPTPDDSQPTRAPLPGNGLGITRGIPFGDVLGLSPAPSSGGGGQPGGVQAGNVGLPRPGAGGIARIPGTGQSGVMVQRATGGGPPVHIVYVVDVSGSMIEGNKMGKAQEAMNKALDELRPEDSFMIVAFSTEAVAYSSGLRPATRAAIAQGHINIGSAQPSGATNISAAFEIALAQKEATHIFFLSDGDPTRGITDYKQLLSFVRTRNTAKARIITLALGLGEKFDGMELLRQMAKENDGRFDYVNLAHR
jgi:hypothetical protein